MRSPRSLVAVLVASLATAAVTALAVAGRPAAAQRAQVVETNGPGRYQLQVLSAQQWLVLDTHTGELRHWSAGTDARYTVRTVDQRKLPGQAYAREVIGPAR